MSDSRMKHLEFVQAVITRMNSNSFVIKGWAVTLVSALFALAAKDSNPVLVFATLYPIAIFWGLDAYYLSQEKLFRRLYESVAMGNGATDFNMDCRGYGDSETSWATCLVSKTVLPLYCGLFAVAVLIRFMLRYSILS